jgi:hypothetical protein
LITKEISPAPRINLRKRAGCGFGVEARLLGAIA